MFSVAKLFLRRQNESDIDYIQSNNHNSQLRSPLSLRIILLNSKPIKIIAIIVTVVINIISWLLSNLEIAILPSSTEKDIKWLLSSSEAAIFIASSVLVVGLIGEYFDDDKWKHSVLYTVAKLCVITGVAAELISNRLMFAATDTLQALDAIKINEATNAAATAFTRALDAEKKTLSLLDENIALERTLAPRGERFDPFALLNAINNFDRIPVVILSVDREEPKDFASHLATAFRLIKIGGGEAWTISTPAPVAWIPEGIVIQYGQVFSDDRAKKLAIEICEVFKMQGIDAVTMPRTSHWPLGAPDLAVVLTVGNKPNDFWMNKRFVEKGEPQLLSDFSCTDAEAIEAGRR